MRHELESPIQRWTTRDVAATRRLDHYAEALTSSVDTMHVVSRNSGSFHAEVASAPLGPIALVHARGGAHRCIRDERDIASGGERNFHLIVNTSSAWSLRHGRHVTLRAGDAVLLDSQLGHEIELGEFDITHLKLPESWLRQWIPSPSNLAGRVMPHDSDWGHALTAFVRRLSPEFVVDTPLPAHVLADQVGALLALTTHALGRQTSRPTRRDTALHDRINECIVQRCTEFSLTATEVATMLQVSTRTLHRSLAACRKTFGAALITARVDLAVRMLESPLLDRLTTAEIGRRAGFCDASHFARVVHRRCGRTPLRIRRARNARSSE